MRKIKVVVLLVRQLQHGFTKNAKVSPNLTVTQQTIRSWHAFFEQKCFSWCHIVKIIRNNNLRSRTGRHHQIKYKIIFVELIRTSTLAQKRFEASMQKRLRTGTNSNLIEIKYQS